MNLHPAVRRVSHDLPHAVEHRGFRIQRVSYSTAGSPWCIGYQVAPARGRRDMLAVTATLTAALQFIDSLTDTNQPQEHA